MRGAIFFVAVFLAALVLRGQSGHEQFDHGLAFASHEVSKDQRTGLDLNVEGDFRFNEDFSLRFDLAFARLINAYGYVVRVIANDTLNIDLMSVPEHDDFGDLTLVINKKPTDLQFDFTDLSLQANEWTSLVISFSYRRNEISLLWNGKKKSQAFDLRRLRDFRFYFGANDFGRFSTTDAPPVVIRDVTIESNGKAVRKWLMQNHAINQVFDSVRNAEAAVQNPIWLIDRRTRWTHRKKFAIGRFPSIAFNSDAATLYATDANNLYQLNLHTGELEVVVTSGKPIHSDANQLLYVSNGNELLNYDLASNKLQRFDFAAGSWPNNDTLYDLPNYWHNNKFYNPFDKTLYTFGGYGHFVYKNTFHRYDERVPGWTEVRTKGSIPPRYLSASGMMQSTNKLLIFGGYGSQSGKQELSPQSFYDLYTFDLQAHVIEKVTDYSPVHDAEDMAFSNSLVVNEAGRCFYVLGFPRNKYQSAIRLRQYSLDGVEVHVLADIIPFAFHDEDSFCDLFYSEATNELIAVTLHQVKEHFEVNVHSINYPPLRAGDVLQVVPGTGYAAAFITAAVLLLVSGVIGWVVYKRRPRADNHVVATGTTEINPTTITAPSSAADTLVPYPAQADQRLCSAILLFGGFQVFDKHGVDISSRFTMTLKDLLVLVLMHSIKYDKGVSTSVIQEYLWPDKDEVSARNNRNVNVKKLRGLLEEVGIVTIENTNAYIRLTMDDHVFCDYRAAFRHLNHSGGNEHDKIMAIIRTAKRGSLLPNMDRDWLDSFKSEISNQIIDCLLEYSQKLDVNKDDKLLIEIADTIFAYDTINQEALVIKCSVLNRKGKYSLAKTWYDHFVKEYRNLYAEKYPRSFEEVIS
jgi:DNA-binding SARP family transcriptional activator